MRKLYTVLTQKEIPSLNGIKGPLTTPVEIDSISVLNMVRRGYEVYQHNPYILTEKVRVTVSNYNKIVFPTNEEKSIEIAKKREEEERIAEEMKIPVVSKEENSSKNNNNNNYNNKKLNKPDSFKK